MVAVNGSGGLYPVLSDHLGTPRQIIDTNKQVRWLWDNLDPFGNNTPNPNPAGLGNFTYNLRFPGQFFDSESGLNYNYYRNYDPKTGRYTQSDPIGLAGGLNTFGYVGGNPVGGVDPDGLRWIPCTNISGADCWVSDPDVDNKPVCATAECAADILPTPPDTPERQCNAKCNAIIGSICGPILKGGINPASSAAFVACRATVAASCYKGCKPDEPCTKN